MPGFFGLDECGQTSLDELTLLVVGLRILWRFTWGRGNDRGEAHDPRACNLVKSSSRMRNLRAARRRMVELRRNTTLATSEEDTACGGGRTSALGFRQWASSQDKRKGASNLSNGSINGGIGNDSQVVCEDDPELLTPVMASGDQFEEDGWDSDDEGGDFDEDPSDGSWLTDRYINNDTHMSRGEFGPYSVYTPDEWAEDLKAKWVKLNRMVNDELLRLVECALHQSTDPLMTTLIVVRSCHKSKANGPHCLARHALEICKKSCAQYGFRKRIHTGLAQSALEVASQVTSPLVLELLVEVFELQHSSLSLPFVETLLGSRNYRDAATLAVQLGLQKRLPVERITTPLFILGQGNVAERFVGDDPSMRKRAVAGLDQLLAPDSDLTVKCSELGIANAQLREKAIEKLVERLIKLYRLRPSDYPNFVDSKNLGSMRNLLYRKYTLHTEGSWNEVIEALVKGNLLLQVGLIETLVLEHKDTDLAVYWAKRFAVPPEALPYAVVKRVDALRDIHYLPEVEDGQNLCDLNEDSANTMNGHTEYYSLDLPNDRIMMVDNNSALRQCIHHVLQRNTIVGMDSEWRPLLSTGGQARMGLLQLATATHCFLLDMVALPKQGDQALLRKLFVQLFTTKDVLVLGYAFDGDLEMLMSTLPGIQDAMQPLRRVVDVRTLSEKVDFAEGKLPINWNQKPKSPTVVDGFTSTSTPAPVDNVAVSTYKHYTSGTGLAGLVQVCFGKPLDKRQQMSDWEKRPLRPQQITYAALDAFCLVQAYGVLRDRAKQLGINPEPWMELRNWSKARRSARLKHEQFAFDDTQGHLSGAVIRPSQLSLVADISCPGLGRQLRCCGVDVALLPPEADRSHVIRVALDENRTIVTCGLPYLMLRKEVPHGRVFAVPAGRIREQVLEVLRNFNVSLLPEDIFSRCQACNSCQYRRISSHDMHIIKANMPSHLASQLPKTATEDQTNGHTTLEQNGHQSSSNGYHTSTMASASPTAQNGHHRELSKANGTNGVHCADGEKLPPMSPSTVPTVSLGKGVSIGKEGAILTEVNLPLHLDAVAAAVMEQVDAFVCCCGCGKIFWENQRSNEVRKQFQLVLDRCSPSSY